MRIFLGLLLLPAGGWALDAARPLSQAVLDAWSREQGLPLNSVYGMAQTPDGFLWLGSQDGLVRFDGTAFHVWRGGDGSGLEGNILMHVLTDSGGRLWTGGPDGLFFGQAGRFSRFSLGDQPGMNSIMSLRVSPDGTVWASTAAGSFRAKDGKVEALPGPTYIRDAAFAPDGRRTYLRLPAGLVVVEDGRPRPLAEVTHGLPAKTSGFTCDAAGRLWVAAPDGLWRLDGDTFAHVFEGPLPLAGRMIFDRTGCLWMGYGPVGGARYNPATNRLEPLPGPLAAMAVMSLLEDRDGSVWIATENDGLWRLRDGIFATLGTPEGLPHAMVNTIAQAPDGTFYAGTNGGGIYWQRGTESGVIRPGPGGLVHPAVTSLCATPEGALWIGYQGGPLQEMRDGKFTTYGVADGVPPFDITQLLQDERGRLWVGQVNGGLLRFEHGKFTALAGQPDAPRRLISAAYRDAAGVLWFGSDRELFRYENETFRAFTPKDGLPAAMVVAITESPKGQLWLGTAGGGILRGRDGKFTAYPPESGLPRAIFALAVDEAQRLWISGNDGVSVVALADIEAYERAGRPIPRRQFTLKDGLRSLEGRAVVGPTVLRAQDGRLWVATGKGASAVDPREFKTAPAPATVFVTGVSVDDQPRAPVAGMAMAPGWKSLRFDYSALELAAPEKIVFDQWLEGYDATWIEAGRRREATYTNLAPGNYVFHVRARRRDGDRAGAEATLAFVVRPFFYQTSWFAVLGVAAGGLGLYGLYLLRLRQIRARNAQLEQTVARRTQELQATSSELAKINAAKDRIIAVIGHDLRGPATSLRALTQILVEEPGAFTPAEVKDIARRIDLACGAQIELLNNLLEWSLVQSGELAIRPALLPAAQAVELTVDLLEISAREKQVVLAKVIAGAPQVYADETSLFTILRNLAGNAIKFTRAGGTVTLTVAGEGDGVCYTVADTGVGMPPERLRRLLASDDIQSTYGTNAERGTGLGLALSRDLARLNGGRLEISSVEGQGTTVRLWLPAAPPA